MCVCKWRRNNPFLCGNISSVGRLVLVGIDCVIPLHLSHSGSFVPFFFFFSQNISILVVLLYSWRISVNVKKYGDLEDVYYGKCDFGTCHPIIPSPRSQQFPLNRVRFFRS